MTRDRWIQIAASLITIVALSGAGWMLPVMNASASDAQLKFTDEAAKGAPPLVVVAQSVGVLRGIITNYMWIRADNLKEAGKFFEAYHLARWISELQPRFASVWQFQAWNMAYNISVATHTREERWQWVRDGIQILRNHGIRYNPGEVMLYRELAWIHIHKIGGFTDDAHRYYKQQLADQWQGILGEPPYDHEAKIEWLREMADAPGAWPRVVAQNPKAADLLRDLHAAGFELNELLLRTAEWLRALGASPLAARAGLPTRVDELATQGVEHLPPRVRQVFSPILALKPILNDPDYADVWPLVLAHTRKHVLLDEYNMDPTYMAQFTEEFGPLDWRSPMAHSVYWAALGVERAQSRYGMDEFERVNTDRILFHSQQALKRIGRIHYDYISQEITWGADLRYIPYYEQTFLLMLDRVLQDEITNPQITYRDGYRNFLIDTVREYYMFGEYEKAEEVYARLRTNQDLHEEHKPDRFLYPLDEFIIRETATRWSSIHVAHNDVVGLLTTAYRRGMARGDMELFNRLWRQARMILDYYHSEVGDAVTVVTTDEGRMGFNWENVVFQAFQVAMIDDMTSMAQRLALWERADVNLKRRSYDLIASALHDALMRSGLPLTMDEAFPPPPGLEEYRRQRAQREQEDQRRLQIERR